MPAANLDKAREVFAAASPDRETLTYYAKMHTAVERSVSALPDIHWQKTRTNNPLGVS